MPDFIMNPAPTGTGITPVMPTEPPPEAKAMNFSFDPELVSSGDGSTVTLGDGTTVKEVPTSTTTETKTTEQTKPTVTETKTEEVKPEVKPGDSKARRKRQKSFR